MAEPKDRRYSIENYGLPIGNYSAVMVVDAIVEDIEDRGGFGEWWSKLSDDEQSDLRDLWAQLVQGVRHPEDKTRGRRK